MTLTVPCHEQASYSSTLKGVGSGPRRDGGAAKAFYLCENHALLYEEIDKELMDDGWARAHAAKPHRLE